MVKVTRSSMPNMSSLSPTLQKLLPRLKGFFCDRQTELDIIVMGTITGAPL